MKPETIQERTFAKAFRGFNPAEVQEFLGQLAGDVRGLSAENAILRLEVAKLESSLRASQEFESKLKRMLERMESTGSRRCSRRSACCIRAAPR
ncbi:MAG: DivIVA domain-containing protein [Ignavibacteria bacterium]|nr:DivIVA domain-containing protein [Ignavibacteria bacterium]